MARPTVETTPVVACQHGRTFNYTGFFRSVATDVGVILLFWHSLSSFSSIGYARTRGRRPARKLSFSSEAS